MAINASGTGDTVLVHDGTYNESLDSMGKAITVRSENGPLTTIVDASGLGRGMSIWQGEDERTVVQGFTFTGGNASPSYGGGMAVVSGRTAVCGFVTA